VGPREALAVGIEDVRVVAAQQQIDRPAGLPGGCRGLRGADAAGVAGGNSPPLLL
jgi:hypothetical protein